MSSVVTSHIAVAACPVSSRSRAAEAAEFAALLVALAAVPLFFHQSQFLTGTVVNTALAVGALRIGCRYRLAAIIMVPALAAAAGAAFLVPASVGLFAMVAAIWAANMAYVALIKRGARNGYPSALLRASMAKVFIMGTTAASLVLFGMLPLALLSVLIPTAFLTALLGGAIGRAIARPEKV